MSSFAAEDMFACGSCMESYNETNRTPRNLGGGDWYTYLLFIYISNSNSFFTAPILIGWNCII